MGEITCGLDIRAQRRRSLSTSRLPTRLPPTPKFQYHFGALTAPLDMKKCVAREVQFGTGCVLSPHHLMYFYCLQFRNGCFPHFILYKIMSCHGTFLLSSLLNLT